MSAIENRKLGGQKFKNKINMKTMKKMQKGGSTTKQSIKKTTNSNNRSNVADRSSNRNTNSTNVRNTNTNTNNSRNTMYNTSNTGANATTVGGKGNKVNTGNIKKGNKGSDYGYYKKGGAAMRKMKKGSC